MKKTLLILSFFSLSLSLFSQKVDTVKADGISNLIPGISQNPYFESSIDKSRLTAPNVASFEKRAKIPVNYSTGQLNFTIPILDVKIDDYLTIPVRLNYTNTGLKPAEIPSWVGNGWDLTVGGQIVQSIKGVDDFSNTGLQNSSVRNFLSQYNANTLTGLSKYNYLKNVIAKEQDAQFDVFSLNFLQTNNRFYLDQNTAHFFKEENLKVEFNSTSFTVTDDHGYRYFFGLKTPSQITYREQAGDSRLEESTVTWYLTQIDTPSGQQVLFNYTADISYELRTESHSISNTDMLVYHWGNNRLECERDNFSYPVITTYSDIVVTQYLLSSITFAGGTVEFEHEDRNDLINSLGNKSKALKAVRLRDVNNAVVRQGIFQYGYMGGTQHDRLQLNRVDVTGQNNSSPDYYLFEYYAAVQPLPIPDLVLPGGVYTPNHRVDYWGFFNSATSNTNKIPAFTYADYRNAALGPVILGGGDRHPQSDLSRSGMLSKITYSDKGYETIEYEGNTVKIPYTSVVPAILAADEIEAEKVVFSSPVSMCNTKSGNFSITETGVTKVYYRGQGGSVQIKVGTATNSTSVLNFSTTSASDFDFVSSQFLSAGTYTYEIISECTEANTHTSAHLEIRNRDLLHKVIKVGGNRVSKIKQYPKTNTPVVRRLDYSGGGDFTYIPHFVYSFPIARILQLDTYCTECDQGRVLNITDYSIHKYEGFHLSYNNVTEISSLSGTVRHVFDPPFSVGEVETLPNNSTILHVPWRNGLSREIHSSAYKDGVPTLTEQVRYTYSSQTIIPWAGEPGLVAAYKYACQPLEYSPAVLNSINTGYSPVFTDKFGQIEEITMTYTDAGVLQTRDSIFVDYNARWQPYRVQKTRSVTGKTVKTSYYSEDFDNGASANISTLKSKHIIGKPLKEVISINGTTANGSVGVPDANGNITQVYNYESNTNHSHSSTTLITSDFSLEESRTYNSKGRLSGFTGRDGVSYVYLWSYNFSHPVALIANATQTQVSAIIGSIDSFGALTSESSIASGLSSLRSSLTLARLTTALYSPSIGIKQLTSDDGMLYHYEYDGMNRLKTVKDRNGKEVDVYTYQNALTLNPN